MDNGCRKIVVKAISLRSMNDYKKIVVRSM